MTELMYTYMTLPRRGVEALYTALSLRYLGIWILTDVFHMRFFRVDRSPTYPK